MGHNIIVSAAAAVAAAAATETKTKVAHIPLNPHPPTRYQYQATPPQTTKPRPPVSWRFLRCLSHLSRLTNPIGSALQFNTGRDKQKTQRNV